MIEIEHVCLEKQKLESLNNNERFDHSFFAPT